MNGVIKKEERNIRRNKLQKYPPRTNTCDYNLSLIEEKECKQRNKRSEFAFIKKNCKDPLESKNRKMKSTMTISLGVKNEVFPPWTTK